jgi:hypothetical protein
MSSITLLSFLAFSASAFAAQFTLDDLTQGVSQLASRRRLTEVATAGKAGDFTLLQRAFEDRDLPVLWFIVVAAKPFRPSPEVAAAHESFLNKTKKLLSEIPGHTQIHIDILEEKARIAQELALRPDGTPNWYPPKGHDFKTMEEAKEWELLGLREFVRSDREFMHLADLGSAECVQTLMTYVWDDRRVGFIGDMDGRYRRAGINGTKALDSLRRILGESRPDKNLVGERDAYSLENLDASRAIYREWWKSEKSLPWRQTISPTSRSALLAKIVTEEQTSGPSSQGIPWLLILSCGLFALAAVWLALKRSEAQARSR